MSRRSSASVFGGIGSPSGVRKLSRRPAALFSLGLNPRMPSRATYITGRLPILVGRIISIGNQAAIRGGHQGRDAALNLTDVARVDRACLHPQKWRHGLDGAVLPTSRGYSRVPDDRRVLNVGRNLLEQLKPFPAHSPFC